MCNRSRAALIKHDSFVGRLFRVLRNPGDLLPDIGHLHQIGIDIGFRKGVPELVFAVQRGACSYNDAVGFRRAQIFHECVQTLGRTHQLMDFHICNVGISGNLALHLGKVQLFRYIAAAPA